jgi:hypothetical protein
LVHVKSNIGAYGPSLGYAIDGEGRFAWTGRSEITAEEMLAGPRNPQERSAVDEACEWLKDFLAAGSREPDPRISEQILEQLAPNALQRAHGAPSKSKKVKGLQ